MSRTLGIVQQNQSQNNTHNQPFYLNDQIQLFLNQNTQNNKSNNHYQEDTKKCQQLIQNIIDMQIKSKNNIDQIKAIIEEQSKLTQSIGFFSAKNMIFLEYLMLLKVYQLYKINAKTLTQGNGLNLYKRLAYLKTLLLKLAPVQKKLEYQKTKILKHAEKATVIKQKKSEEQSQQQSQNNNQNEKFDEDIIKQQIQGQDIQQDQMNFKPRPLSLMNIKKQKQIKIQRNDKYEAPKISSNLSKQDKLKQRFQKQKQRKKLNLIRRLQSDLIQGERAQQKYLGDQVNEKLRRKFQQKKLYEQQAFVRLPDTKKEKFFKKQTIRNSMRKNQLEQDYKQVQMVRKLFDEENQIQKKIISQKRKDQKTHQIKKNNKGNKNFKK